MIDWLIDILIDWLIISLLSTEGCVVEGGEGGSGKKDLRVVSSLWRGSTGLNSK